MHFYLFARLFITFFMKMQIYREEFNEFYLYQPFFVEIFCLSEKHNVVYSVDNAADMCSTVHVFTHNVSIVWL